MFGRPSFLHAIRGAQQGVALLEFALLFPVFILLIMGGLDLGLSYYAKTVLESEMRSAGRASTLDMNNGEASQADLDAKVRARVQQIIGNATVDFTRTYYRDYELAQSKAERFIDTPPYDNICNHKEIYVDANNNGKYDMDAGMTGQGGGKDVVIYSAVAKYNRLFPMMSLAGLSDSVTLTATTILRNQPFAEQADPPLGVCPW